LLVGAIGLLGGQGIAAKGSYLAYGVALLCALGGIGLLALAPAPQRPLGVLLLAAALPAQALAMVLVARHYGGNDTLAASALVIVLALAIGATRLLPAPPWKLERGTLTVAFFSAIVFAALIPITGSYYTGSRFATVNRDMETRLAHWSEVLSMMDSDSLTTVFGQGLGRFPSTFHWKNTHGEIPGGYSYNAQAGNRYLQLTPSQYALSYGEVLRMLQHVDVKPGQRYTLSMDIRRHHASAWPSVMVCERWLIYPQVCSIPKLVNGPVQAGWQTLTAELPVRSARSDSWGAPLVLEISNSSHQAPLEVDNVSLREVDSGRELLRNGSFSDAHNFWFFSSDRNHMPWHVKNFAINQYFELGWAGVAATAVLLLAVGAPLLARGLGGDSFATICLASLTGCMMVGLFDSITDVPRLSLLFLLVALAGCLKPARQRIKVRRQRGAEDQDADALMA
ncbi:hypothetical protein, partial [Pseudoduganella sp. OTU4001]|uniref:hypothetical protein n=1 Tax=Pseudoduganella sp. OTU4001 TaxID=3043854 RepID=UPI00313BC2CD